MLVALFTYLMLSGGGSMGVLDFIADMEASIKPVVVNDERRKKALATIKAMNKHIETHNKNVKQISKELNKELTEHETRSNEINILVDQHIDLISDTSRDLIELRFQLRDQLTRDEWERVFSKKKTG